MRCTVDNACLKSRRCLMGIVSEPTKFERIHQLPRYTLSFSSVAMWVVFFRQFVHLANHFFSAPNSTYTKKHYFANISQPSSNRHFTAGVQQKYHIFVQLTFHSFCPTDIHSFCPTDISQLLSKRHFTVFVKFGEVENVVGALTSVVSRVTQISHVLLVKLRLHLVIEV